MVVKFQISNNDNIRHKYFSTDEAFPMARYKLARSFRVHQRDTLFDAGRVRVQNTCQINNVSIRVYRIHLGSCDYWRTQTVCSVEVEELPMHEKTVSGEKGHNYCQY
jgi:hypothetical protein